MQEETGADTKLSVFLTVCVLLLLLLTHSFGYLVCAQGFFTGGLEYVQADNNMPATSAYATVWFRRWVEIVM